MEFAISLIAATLICIWWTLGNIRDDIREFIEAMYEYEESEENE